MKPLILSDHPHYVIAVKPRGVLSQSPSAHTGQIPDMITLLSQTLDSPIYPVHRLDRETAGIMVYAKTQKGAAALSRIVSENGLDKQYLAVCAGVPEETSGEMHDLLYHDVRKNKSYVVTKKRNGVQEARLGYKTLETLMHEGTPLSLVRVKLYTGRTHQIRVQFASRTLPLVGDTRYGSTFKKEELCLFSESLHFTDPFDGTDKSFHACAKDLLCDTDSAFFSPIFAKFSHYPL